MWKVWTVVKLVRKMKLIKTLLICTPLIFGVDKIMASVYLKPFTKKEMANKLVFFTRASGKYLSALAQGNRLMERTGQVIVQLWPGPLLSPSCQGWLPALAQYSLVLGLALSPPRPPLIPCRLCSFISMHPSQCLVWGLNYGEWRILLLYGMGHVFVSYVNISVKAFLWKKKLWWSNITILLMGETDGSRG